MTRVFLNSVRINNLNKVDFINLLIVICLYLHFNTTQVWFQFYLGRRDSVKYCPRIEQYWSITVFFTQCLHGAILIAALQKVPAFPGYKAILQRLKFLPSFWTWIVLIIILLSRIVSLSFSSESSLQMLIMIVFSVSYVVKILLMGFFNYTQLKMLKNNYPKSVFVLSKLALFVFVVECLVSFAMSFLSMLLKVEEIPNLGKGEKLDVMRTSDILRQVSVAFFRLKILSFFWQKLFVDDKNILSNFENLPDWAIVVWRGTRISNSNNVNDAREVNKKEKKKKEMRGESKVPFHPRSRLRMFSKWSTTR